MARVLGPFLSMSASKTLGGVLTAKTSRGINVMSIKSNPSNPKTVTQMATRAAFAAVGKIAKRAKIDGEVVGYLKTKRTSGQTWGSYFQSQELGTGLANFNASKTAYNTAGNSAKKTLFDTAAAAASIESVDLDGTTNTQVPAGLALWNAYEASFRISDPLAPVTAASATQAQINAYTEGLTGVLPS